MEVDGHLKLMALDLACQRLAQRAKLLAQAGTIMDFGRLAKIDRLVTESIEGLDLEITRTSSTKKEKKSVTAAALLKLLRGGDESGHGDGEASRSLDTPPSPDHVLALRGVGDVWPPPDLLGFLSSQRKTGLLEVATASEVFGVEFDAGDIVHARVNPPMPEQRLGDVLVASGAIDRVLLERLRRAKPKEKLGDLLLRGGHVTQEQLLGALKSQIQILFNRLFVARAVRFSFWIGPPMLAEGSMRMNAMALILEGARTFDEENTANSGVFSTNEEAATMEADATSDTAPAPWTPGDDIDEE
jgi:hypothetical protein